MTNFAAAFDRSLIAAEIAHHAGFQPTTEAACIEDRAGRAAAPAACPKVAAATTALAKAQTEYDAARRALDAPTYSRIQLSNGYARVARYNAARAAMRAAEDAFDAATADARAAGRPA